VTSRPSRSAFEQHERLNKARKRIDPERLKQIDVLFDAE
jgi:hypothetical protein